MILLTEENYKLSNEITNLNNKIDFLCTEKSVNIIDKNEKIIKELRMLETENTILNKNLFKKNKYIDIISNDKVK